mmetsp:Transcript_8219/g.18730  ORF Transcript_8219/g.18730 Transcript_8219/m.18730 type:complete len:125 (-) Transcript_8219:80-454(-)
MHICVFKTRYIPRKYKSKLTFRRHLRRIFDGFTQSLKSRWERFRNRFESQEYKEYKQIAGQHIYWVNDRFDRTLALFGAVFDRVTSYFSDMLTDAANDQQAHPAVVPNANDQSLGNDDDDDDQR